MQVLVVLFIHHFFFMRNGFRMFFRTIFFAVGVVVMEAMSNVDGQVFQVIAVYTVRFFRREGGTFRVKYV